MRCEKSPRGHRNGQKLLFINYCDGAFNISAGVRDEILPHRYVWIDINTEKRTIEFEPTNDERAYKMALTGKHDQGKVCYCKGFKIMNVPEKKRLLVMKEQNKLIAYVDKEAIA